MPCFVKQSIARSCQPAQLSKPRQVFLTLEDLEVLEIRVLCVHIELDSRHGNIEVDAVEDLAERRTTLQGSVGRSRWGGTEG